MQAVATQFAHKAMDTTIPQPARYALRNDDGQWLHCSLSRHEDTNEWRMTEVSAWRWTPTEAQLRRALDKHPSLKVFRVAQLPARTKAIPV